MGVITFSVGNSLSHIAEKHRGRTLLCFRIVLISNKNLDKRGITTLSNLLSHSTKKLVGEPFCASENFWCGKNLWIGGGIARFSVKNFLSHNTEKHRGEPLCASEKLGFRKFLCLVVGFHDIPSKIFSLTVPKNIMGNPSVLPKIWGFEKTLCVIGRYHDFSSKFFSLTVPKNFVGGPLCFKNDLVSKNLWIVGVSRFCRIFLPQSAKKFRGEPFNVSKKIGVSKIFLHKRRVSRLAVETF